MTYDPGSVEERIADIKAGWRRICRRCKRWIARGERIKQIGSRNGKPRWGHVECKPEATGQEASAVLVEAVAELQARLADVELSATPRVIEIKYAEGEAVKIEGAVDPIFDSVLQLAQARKHIFLPGPAGCGKSHLAKQIADALKLRFGFIFPKVSITVRVPRILLPTRRSPQPDARLAPRAEDLRLGADEAQVRDQRFRLFLNQRGDKLGRARGVDNHDRQITAREGPCYDAVSDGGATSAPAEVPAVKFAVESPIR